MNPNNVNPNDWEKHEVIFNDVDEGYSAVWGKFRDEYTLGIRWNGSDDKAKGYPVQGAHPLWFVVPKDLIITILQQLLLGAIKNKLKKNKEELYATKILNAIEKFTILNT